MQHCIKTMRWGVAEYILHAFSQMHNWQLITCRYNGCCPVQSAINHMYTYVNLRFVDIFIYNAYHIYGVVNCNRLVYMTISKHQNPWIFLSAFNTNQILLVGSFVGFSFGVQHVWGKITVNNTTFYLNWFNKLINMYIPLNLQIQTTNHTFRINNDNYTDWEYAVCAKTY